MAFLTAAQRTLVQEAYDLLAKSYVTEQATVPEEVAKKLSKLGLAFSFNEGNVLSVLRDHPIRSLLWGILYLDANT